MLCALLQRASFVSAPAAADALVLVALVVLLELGGIAAVFAAIRMAGFDFAGAAFVLALFLHVIDFHLCSSLRRGHPAVKPRTAAHPGASTKTPRRDDPSPDAGNRPRVRARLRTACARCARGRGNIRCGASPAWHRRHACAARARSAPTAASRTLRTAPRRAGNQ